MKKLGKSKNLNLQKSHPDISILSNDTGRPDGFANAHSGSQRAFLRGLLFNLVAHKQGRKQ